MLKLVLANLRSHKIRALTAIGAAAMAFALYGLLAAFDFGMRSGAGSGGEDRLVVMPRYPGGLPHHYLETLRGLTGVRMAGSQVRFHGRSDRDRRPVVSIAVDTEGFFELFPEAITTPESRQRWVAERTGALVGKTLAARLGWHVGDTVWIRSDLYRNREGDNLWPLKVSGVFDVLPGQGNADGLFFHYDYFQHSTPEQTGESVTYFIVRVSNPATLPETAQTIDARFANSTAETRTATEKAMVRRLVQQLGDVSVLLAWISAAAALAMVLVNLSAAIQSVQARRGGLAVLKAIGFPERRIGWLVVMETCLIMGLGGCLGLLLANAVTRAPLGNLHALLPLVPPRKELLALLAIPLLGDWPLYRLSSPREKSGPRSRCVVPDRETLMSARGASFYGQFSAAAAVHVGSWRAQQLSWFVALAGMALVAFILGAILAVGEGIKAMLAQSGSEGVAIVVSQGATEEINSVIPAEQISVLSTVPGIEPISRDVPISAETYLTLSLPLRITGAQMDVPLRGVDGSAAQLRRGFRLRAGRIFRPGTGEVLVGSEIAHQYAGVGIGSTISTESGIWRVAGVFDAGGGVAESEVWADVKVVQSRYRRDGLYQSARLRLRDGWTVPRFTQSLERELRLPLTAIGEKEYYARQSETLLPMVRAIGAGVAVLMGLGAVFGALNAMYGAVQRRQRGMSILKSLGFQNGPLLCAIEIEALLLGVVGGACGSVLAYLCFNGLHASTLNQASSTQLAFAFAVTPRVMMIATLYTGVLGLICGLIPGAVAARQPASLALRGA